MKQTIAFIFLAFLSSLSYGQIPDSVKNLQALLRLAGVSPNDTAFLHTCNCDILSTPDTTYGPWDTTMVCRNVSNTAQPNWWQRVDNRPWPRVLYLAKRQVSTGWKWWTEIVYLDSKKHPLKPWIRVWEN